MKPKDCSIKGKKYVHITERERYKIEGRTAQQIAADLVQAFDTYCAPAATSTTVGATA